MEVLAGQGRIFFRAASTGRHAKPARRQFKKTCSQGENRMFDYLGEHVVTK